MGGIDSGGATAGDVQVAQYILLASLLFGIYEAWTRGGDTHFLGAAVRFFAVGLVMINYGIAFRDVNGMFNNVASFINISTAGGGDVFAKWMADLSTYWNNNNGIQALWGLITGAFSGDWIQGRQIVRYAPWQIPVEALDTPDVRERVRQIKEGDRPRRPISTDTQTMMLPSIE